jgi:cell division protein FtsL
MPIMSDAVIIALITSLIGGTLVAVINHFFARKKTDAESDKLRAETDKIRIEVQNLQREGDKIQNIAKQTEQQAQIIYYNDFSETFLALERSIQEQITELKNEGSDYPEIKLKLLAVAMTYSWRNFVTTKIPRILEQYTDVNIKLEILFANHAFLKSIPMIIENEDWAEESKKREKDIEDFVRYCKQFQGRIQITARTYNNLPHWHGWLVNDRHLFLGRVKWAFSNEGPILKVGQNEYRHFDRKAGKESQDRIKLFQQWYRYYFQYASKPSPNTNTSITT